jgi:hypothetical protein
VTYRKEELAAMIAKMRELTAAFYPRACVIGCHAFIEFTGLMNEYIKLCEEALAQGIDFTEASIHGGKSLPMQSYQRDYLNEKLECIYGRSLDELSKRP